MPPSDARRATLRGIAAWLGCGWFRRVGAGERKAQVTALYADEPLSGYGFPAGHPLGIDRQGAFLREARARGLLVDVAMPASRLATVEELARFHTRAHIDKVASAEREGLEFLDNGDTPVFPGVFEAASRVAGAALDGLERIIRGEVKRTFQPIGGLHHAGRNHSAGFCVFNDIGVVIEALRAVHGIRRIAYVDIDVHHGDGVFYPYEDDPDVIIADVHEDGRYLYPGTGSREETGRGAAEGTKLNLPLPPGADDAAFAGVWEEALAHLERFKPEFFILQCGADSLAGDPITHMGLSDASHGRAARDLASLADRLGHGRVLGLGGGGYNRANLARAWTAVIEGLLSA